MIAFWNPDSIPLIHYIKQSIENVDNRFFFEFLTYLLDAVLCSSNSIKRFFTVAGLFPHTAEKRCFRLKDITHLKILNLFPHISEAVIGGVLKKRP